MLVLGIFPGPKGPNNEELNGLMKLVVDDLIRLYRGVMISTPLFPEGNPSCFLLRIYVKKVHQGRLVRVALVAVCCDHPAMCRMCGFGDHATKTAFCHRCTIPRSALATEQGLTIGGMYIFH